MKLAITAVLGTGAVASAVVGVVAMADPEGRGAKVSAGCAAGVTVCLAGIAAVWLW